MKVKDYPARGRNRMRGGPDKRDFLGEYLKFYLKESDLVLLWLDCDRVGENI